MTDKEKFILAVIVAALGFLISYRVEYLDTQIYKLNERVDKLIYEMKED